MNLTDTATLTGVLERIIFFNDENAYCIAEVSDSKTNKKNHNHRHTSQCSMWKPLALKGEWIEHEKHGKQFKVGTFSLNYQLQFMASKNTLVVV